MILILATFSVLLVSCGKSLEGKWVTTADIVTKEIVFTEVNKGTNSTLGVTQDIVWTVEDGKLAVSTAVLGFTTHIYENASHSIDGDKLTIIEDGKATVYTNIEE